MWNELFSQKIMTSRKAKQDKWLLFLSFEVNWICLSIEFIVPRILVRIRSSVFSNNKTDIDTSNVEWKSWFFEKGLIHNSEVNITEDGTEGETHGQTTSHEIKSTIKNECCKMHSQI